VLRYLGRREEQDSEPAEQLPCRDDLLHPSLLAVELSAESLLESAIPAP
jgi:hypothetical protein